MATWWVAAQDTRAGVKYVVVASGNNQFPSGDLPSISEAAGPYSTQAAAQKEAATLNGTAGAGTGITAVTGGQPWWVIDATSGNPSRWVITQFATQPQPANPKFTVTGPYPTQDAAVASLPDGAKYTVQSWDSFLAGVITDIKTFIKGAAAGATGSVNIGNPLGWLATIGDFFHRLTEGATWIRIGEFVLGVALISLGIAHLTDKVPAATKIAKKLGAAAII